MTRPASRAAVTVAVVAMACFPAPAAAAWTTVSAFTGPEVDAAWRVNGPNGAVTTSAQGVHIATPPTAPVTVYRQLDLPHPIDTVSLTVVAPSAVQAHLLWHVPGTPEDRTVQFPVTLRSSGELPTTLHFSLLNYRDWSKHADAFGLRVPAGASLTLTEMRFTGYPWYERWGNALRSLLVFDNFTRHSINFLWGPLLAFDPHTRTALYDASPPISWSVNRVLLFVLAIMIAGLSLAGWLLPLQHRRLLLAGLGMIAGAWLLFDLRMGSEILSYALTDLRTYVSQPDGKRSLRGMADFHDIMERFLRTTKDKERVGFVSDPSLLLESSATYMAYPRQVAFPDDPQDGVDTWLVYLHTNAAIDEQQRLVVNGVVLSGTGTARLLEQSNGHIGIVTTAP